MVQLVARPPIHLPSFSKWDPQRKDEVFLYVMNHHNHNDPSTFANRESYRYRLTIIDHPTLTVKRTKPIISRRTSTRSSTQQRQPPPNNGSSVVNDDEGLTPTTSFTYTNAVFLIPAGRETEYIFSSLSGLRSILKSANTARLIAVAFGRNYVSDTFDKSNDAQQSFNSSENMSIEVVQEELRYVIQMIGSAIPSETLSASLTMKPNMSTTFYPFMALNGLGQRNIIDTGTTTCSGRYIVEQCAISSSDDDGGGDAANQWVRRLYFLDGNPNVIQSEVYVSRKDVAIADATIESIPCSKSSESGEVWMVDKSVTAFDYHKSLTAGLLGFFPVPNEQSTLTYNGLLIGLGGGSLINLWHYIHGDIDTNINRTDSLSTNLWNVTAIELDEAIVQIASKNFGLNVDHPSLRIRIGDGLHVHTTVTESNGTVATTNVAENGKATTSLAFQSESLDYIVLDVDSKETGAGMSCPPASFVETSYLQTLYSLLHPDHGILAINVAARDIHLFHKTCQAVQCVFPYIFLSKKYPSESDSGSPNEECDLGTEPEDLNVVVFATRSILHTENFSSSVPDLSDRVEQWMMLHSGKADNIEERILLQSVLKECLTDFVPYSTSKTDNNDSADQEPTINATKSGSSGKRRKNRRKG